MFLVLLIGAFVWWIICEWLRHRPKALSVSTVRLQMAGPLGCLVLMLLSMVTLHWQARKPLTPPPWWFIAIFGGLAIVRLIVEVVDTIRFQSKRDKEHDDIQRQRQQRRRKQSENISQ